MRFLTVICVALLLPFATGCPQTTIHTKWGGEVTGDIRRTDKDYVYVLADEPQTPEEFAKLVGAEPRAGAGGMREGQRLFRVDRRTITDVDYPGNVLGTIGIGISLVGAGIVTAVIVAESQCTGDFCGLGYVFAVFPGALVVVAGAFPTVIGWSLYRDERVKMDPETGEASDGSGALGLAEVRLSPFVSPTEKGANAGLSTVLNW